MAKVIVTLKIMPETPQVDIDHLAKDCERVIVDYTKEPIATVDKEPFAFGLIAIKFVFKMSESLGGTEPLEKELSKVAGVVSAEVVGLDRTF